MEASVQREHEWVSIGVSPAHTAAGLPEDSEVALPPRADLDRRLATVVSEATAAWVLDEQFDAKDEIWRIDLLRADREYGWRLQRYKYDTVGSVMHFCGEQPVRAHEARSLCLNAVPLTLKR
jgi:hypothetical protein